MNSFIFSTSILPRRYALSLWTMRREGVERFAVDENVHLHEIAFAIADELVIE